MSLFCKTLPDLVVFLLMEEVDLNIKPAKHHIQQRVFLLMEEVDLNVTIPLWVARYPVFLLMEEVDLNVTCAAVWFMEVSLPPYLVKCFSFKIKDFLSFTLR